MEWRTPPSAVSTSKARISRSATQPEWWSFGTSSPGEFTTSYRSRAVSESTPLYYDTTVTLAPHPPTHPRRAANPQAADKNAIIGASGTRQRVSVAASTQNALWRCNHYFFFYHKSCMRCCPSSRRALLYSSVAPEQTAAQQ